MLFGSTTLRSLRKHKGFAMVNVLGLALGMMASVGLGVWVLAERSVDQFHPQVDRIYQILADHTLSSGQVASTQATPVPLAPFLKQAYPEVEEAARVLMNSSPTSYLKSAGDMFSMVTYSVDEAFFDIFSVTFLEGDPQNPFPHLAAILVSDEVAERLYQGESALGRRLMLPDGSEVEITGVFRSDLFRSSFEYEVLAPMERLLGSNPNFSSWNTNSVRTFVRLHGSADVERLDASIRGAIQANAPGSVAQPFLFPFKDRYLRIGSRLGNPSGSRSVYVAIFSGVSLFILLLACINFVNLSTARTVHRAREIGVRKALGARKGALIAQFLSESLLLSLFAMGFAWLVLTAVKPLLASMTERQLNLSLLNMDILVLVVGVVLAAGLVAGIIPAFYMASQGTLETLRGKVRASRSSVWSRQGMVVFQFLLSGTLIAGSLVVQRQVQYLISKDVGIDKEDVLYFSMSADIAGQFDSFRQTLSQYPSVRSVSSADTNPLSVGSAVPVRLENAPPESRINAESIQAGHDFVETVGLQILQGRGFLREMATDTSAVLINEALASALGLQTPVGERIQMSGGTYTVTGVVKNFHSQNLRNEIGPLVIRLASRQGGIAYVRAENAQISKLVADLRQVHAEFDTRIPLQVGHLEQFNASQYRRETMIGVMARVFAGFAIVISCLGLFGLASFTAEQRTKEIGVRKVLGASVARLVALLSGNFIKPVIVAFALTVPLTWYGMGKWLDRFAYRVDMDMGTFVIGGAIMLSIAWLTVFWQCLRAALVNPVEVLKQE